jgi:hypothetical protein
MITYRHDGLSPFQITVKLEGKVVGRILRQKNSGYFYRPLGGKAGDFFDTPEACKQSLEIFHSVRQGNHWPYRTSVSPVCAHHFGSGGSGKLSSAWAGKALARRSAASIERKIK